MQFLVLCSSTVKSGGRLVHSSKQKADGGQETAIEGQRRRTWWHNMVMHACKLDLPLLHRSSEISSLLLESFSASMALMFSDSTIFLYAGVSLTSSSSASSPTLIPAVSTASTFLRLQESAKSTPRVVFFAAGPRHSTVHLRAWILSPNGTYTRVYLNFRKDLRSSADLGLRQGFSITLAGSVNAFVIYSVVERKVCVFSVKLMGEEKVGLLKCATIECSLPVYSMKVSMGFLVLGEENGIRAFPMRPLLKAVIRKKREPVEVKSTGALDSEFTVNSMTKRKNGVIGGGLNGTYANSTIFPKYPLNCSHGRMTRTEAAFTTTSHYCSSGAEVHLASSKQKALKLRQESSSMGSFFVSFKCSDMKSSNCRQPVVGCLKAVSIYPLSRWRFLVLDSDGDIHLLSFHDCSHASGVGGRSSSTLSGGQIRKLKYTMKAQMIAVYPDISSRTHTVWISDGSHSLHLVSITDLDFDGTGVDIYGYEEMPTQITASHAIFTSEKIHDTVPFASNAVLVLGQGNIFGYTIA